MFSCLPPPSVGFTDASAEGKAVSEPLAGFGRREGEQRVNERTNERRWQTAASSEAAAHSAVLRYPGLLCGRKRRMCCNTFAGLHGRRQRIHAVP